MLTVIVLASLLSLPLSTVSHSDTLTPRTRAVQRWTLWATNDAGMPLTALLRFTSLDACYWASLRFGLTKGETATCLPYMVGDFKD